MIIFYAGNKLYRCVGPKEDNGRDICLIEVDRQQKALRQVVFVGNNCFL